MTGDAYLILLVILSIAAVSSCAAYLVSLGTRERRGGVGTVDPPTERMPKPERPPYAPVRYDAEFVDEIPNTAVDDDLDSRFTEPPAITTSEPARMTEVPVGSYEEALNRIAGGSKYAYGEFDLDPLAGGEWEFRARLVCKTKEQLLEGLEAIRERVDKEAPIE